MKLRTVACKRLAATVPALVVLLGAPAVAFAQTPPPICPDTLPNAIYGTGGSAFKPTIAKVAAKLAALPEPITVLYATPSGCNGIWAFSQAGYKITQTLSYWNAAGVESTCTPPAGGVDADFGNQQTEAASCDVNPLPAGVGDFIGSVQTFNFVVHKDSPQTNISKEALYFIYGFGPAGEAAPWTNDATIFARPHFSAASVLIGKFLGIPPTRLYNLSTAATPSPQEKANNVDVRDALTALTGADAIESGIGYISGNYADANRAVIRTLALQDEGQVCAVYPDSTLEATDKAHVRDGHYSLWAYNHFFARVDQAGQIVDPSVRKLVGLFAGTVSEPTIDINRIEIETANIPQCAMRVKRDSDLGPLSSYAPPAPCGCLFESIATGTATCDPCTGDDQCSTEAPKCRNGFCEAY